MSSKVGHRQQARGKTPRRDSKVLKRVYLWAGRKSRRGRFDDDGGARDE